MIRKLNLTRTLIIIASQLITFYIVTLIDDNVIINSFTAALILILVLAFLNSLIRPILISITMPITIFTLGIFSLIIDAILLSIAVYLIPGIQVNTFGSLILMTFLLAITNIIVTSATSVDEFEEFYRFANKQQKKFKTANKEVDTKTPGFVFFEIDGLAYPILLRAIQNAYMPTLNNWLYETHSIIKWETDTSSATPGSQAGILFGNNKNIPAFRWFDRKTQKIITCSSPDDAKNIEKKHSTKNSLLRNNGASIINMFSGDAKDAILTNSRFRDQKIGRKSELYYFFSSPYIFARILFLTILDIYRETKDSVYQKKYDVKPRLEKGRKYKIIRAMTTIIMRDIALSTIIGEMIKNTPVMYATFVGYDEVAHHSGIERSEAMHVLSQIDKQILKVYKATKKVKKPYYIIILSDHGQSQGATFLQRYNYSLEDLVQNLTNEKIYKNNSVDEGHERLGLLVSEMSKNQDSVSNKVVTKAASQMDDIPIYTNDSDTSINKDENIIVLPSGNLGLVYFKGSTKKLTYEQLIKKYPNLIKSLVKHPGIGFIMVETQKDGPLVIGKGGHIYLETNKITKTNPLKNFGDNAIKHLLRTSEFTNCPDILINSFYNPQTQEIAAFEELIGAHGGMGGYQTQPFVMFPKEFETKNMHNIIGAQNINKLFNKWLKKYS